MHIGSPASSHTVSGPSAPPTLLEDLDQLEMSEEDSAEQRARAKLRTDFIKIINNGFVGKQSDIVLYSGFTCESAIFRGADRDVLHFGVEGLNTPAGIVPAAKLRATDVLSLTVKLD